MRALSRPVEERFQSGFEMEKALANFVLRNAKSVDDSSVAMFLQHLFKEEFEAPSDHVPKDGDDFGEGKTAQREKPKTITATPVPTTPGRRGIMDDDDEPSVRTEEFTPHARPRTEQMPAMKRPSRKLEPLPVQEPSVVVRPSVGLPDITSGVSATEKASSPGETEPALAPADDLPPLEKSKAPIMGALAVAAIGLVGLLGYIVTRPNEAPQLDLAPIEVPTVTPTEPAPEPKKEPVVVVPEPVTPPVIDAGQEVVAVAPPPKTDPEPVKTEKVDPKKTVAARTFGSLSVKAVPFATVILPGGKTIEVTGMKTIQAPRGTYEISLVHPKKKLKQPVTVKANQTTSVTFSAD
jgi:serine/threonine-protein kinase